MKCYFSSCGKYLHIAHLEGRIIRAHNAKTDKELTHGTRSSDSDIREDDSLSLSCFVTTHRLSDFKTTRSPPRLVHKVRLNLGKFSALSLQQLPMTFTWTAGYLYLSISGIRLNVFRIQLFRLSKLQPFVTVPRLSVMLPLSAGSRQVYYFPPKDGDHRGIVLMSSYTPETEDKVQLQQRTGKRRSKPRPNEITSDLCHLFRDCSTPLDAVTNLMPYPCPSIGFYVHEDKDLGGWSSSKAEKPVAQGEKFRDGRLIRRIENFSYQDDMDLEGICERCNGLVYLRPS